MMRTFAWGDGGATRRYRVALLSECSYMYHIRSWSSYGCRCEGFTFMAAGKAIEEDYNDMIGCSTHA